MRIRSQALLAATTAALIACAAASAQAQTTLTLSTDAIVGYYADQPNVLLFQSPAVERAETVFDFYDYRVAASHTGFEERDRALFFFYRDISTPESAQDLSLVVTMGCDQSDPETSCSQPRRSLDLRYTGVPEDAVVTVSDDPTEFRRADTGGDILGDFTFVGKTDGGVVEGIPRDGDWEICLTMDTAAINGSTQSDPMTDFRYFFGDGRDFQFDPSREICFKFTGNSGDAQTLTVNEGVEALVCAYISDATNPPDAAATWSVDWDDPADATADGGTVPANETFCFGHVYAADNVGEAEFTAVVDASAGGMPAQGSVAVTVNNVPPTVVSVPPGFAEQGLELTYDIEVTDPGLEDPVSFALASGPAGVAVDAGTGVVSWTPGIADVGVSEICVDISDDEDTIQHCFSVEVLASCSDGELNGDETGLDCGGTQCAACGVGLPCLLDVDCETGVCDGLTLVCIASTLCGNGQAEVGEDCDDFNRDGGDGCSRTCTIEDGYTCSPADLGEILFGSTCDPICGDGNVVGDEVCDGSAFTADCTSLGFSNGAGAVCGTDCDVAVYDGCAATCGDGNVEPGEACDDGNTEDGDGCSAACDLVETGFECDVFPLPGLPPSYYCRGICGDGEIVGDEVCDGDNLNGLDCTSLGYSNAAGAVCNFNCLLVDQRECAAVCGDGNVEPTETCDDGNDVSGDGCSNRCRIESGYTCGLVTGDGGDVYQCSAVCGDTRILGDELCDDGNTDAGDGCDDTCNIEDGWTCVDVNDRNSDCVPECGDGFIRGDEVCDDGNTDADDGCSDVCEQEIGYLCVVTGETASCTPECGDGLIRGDEECDDDNDAADDGCTACVVDEGWSCGAEGTPCMQIVICGDGMIGGDEGCDDGDTASGDGCTADCAVEDGYTCTVAAPSVCTADPVCGDGERVGDESCDDGNVTSGDGCSAGCEIEPGYSCPGDAPSVCTPNPVCGDGAVEEGEACDDGNTSGGDGCSAGCAVEAEWECDNSDGSSVCTETESDGYVVAGGKLGNCSSAAGGGGIGFALGLLGVMVAVRRRR